MNERKQYMSKQFLVKEKNNKQRESLNILYTTEKWNRVRANYYTYAYIIFILI